MEKKEFEFNGNNAIVIIPDNFNGKWIWKTEFFLAFDKAENDLLELGYARVYYQVSNKYGNNEAIRLMHKFHIYIIEHFHFEKQAILFGFSRGGLYAFNYTLFYPEYVAKVYLDAPVLDIRSWPPTFVPEYQQCLDELSLDSETLKTYKENPVNNLKEYFDNNIPTLLVAGMIDDVVPYDVNAKKMIDYCKENNINLTYYVKPKCKHHPHSIENNTKPIIDFILYN